MPEPADKVEIQIVNPTAMRLRITTDMSYYNFKRSVELMRAALIPPGPGNWFSPLYEWLSAMESAIETVERRDVVGMQAVTRTAAGNVVLCPPEVKPDI